MPLYEYRCTHCGENTEILQKISDPIEKTCPHCHKDTLKKQVSAPQFHLKGSGWYVTDFRDQKKTEPAKTDAKTETKTEVATEIKKEASVTEPTPKKSETKKE